MITLQSKVKEFKEKYIKNVWNVVEVGEYDMCGYSRQLFKDAEDFCKIDCKISPEVDIVTDCNELHKLFDYDPDVVLCLNSILFRKKPERMIKSIRKMLMPGGYLIISVPAENNGSYADIFFSEYKILDLCELLFEENRTICGIAQKPLK